MNILALDTASRTLSVALRAGEETWYTEVDAGMRHSELLMDLCGGLLNSAGLEPSGLGGLLCMKGPGSFTGLRIGFAAVKGIALGLNIPWAAVPTLDCMARPHTGRPAFVLPVIDARKKSFFTALYKTNAAAPELLTGYLDIDAAGISRLVTQYVTNEKMPVLLAGPDGELLKKQLKDFLPGDLFSLLHVDPRGGRGNARELLEIAIEQNILEQKKGKPADEEGPMYLRKSDAELNLQSAANC
ncbi:tRNA (adenosine(37)-N6)-threonylcarbamoyltransferase complex dimerization subunit type 1 TsaB [Spirochaetia bacterium]|nr:tRNA (adenosine(37)-N6)-threonylcarbamoyltransferase complex dimerization subunit type 1 TsaB [Spirochaetia bacterium]